MAGRSSSTSRTAGIVRHHRHTRYSQDDIDRHFVQSTTSRQYQICDSTAVRRRMADRRAYVTVEDSGHWVNFRDLHRNSGLRTLVASLRSTTAVTSGTAAARFLSLLDTSSNNDISLTARAILIGRRGGSTPMSNWGTRRSSTCYADTASAGGHARPGGHDLPPVPRPSSTAATGPRSPRRRLSRSTSDGSVLASPVPAHTSAARGRTSPSGGSSDDIDATDRDELYSDQSVAFALA